jgi:hypothetical protein
MHCYYCSNVHAYALLLTDLAEVTFSLMLPLNKFCLATSNKFLYGLAIILSSLFHRFVIRSKRYLCVISDYIF